MLVSSQKLKQLRNVLESAPSLVVLKGPSGSGKATALAHVCGELGMPLYTYYWGQWDWAEFVNRRLLKSKRIVVLAKGYLDIDAFGKSASHIDFTNLLTVVFSVTEGSASDFRSIRKLAMPVVEIVFHSFSESAVYNFLITHVAGDEHRLAQIARSSNGDLRQALNQVDSVASSGNVKQGKRRKLLPIEDTQSSKDAEFSFFHIIGKILYNKANVSPGQLAELPAISDTGLCAIETLHENIPDFVEEISTLESIIAAFCFADTMAREEVCNWFVMSTICQVNVSPRKPGTFVSFRKKKRMLRRKGPFPAQSIGLIDNVLKQTGGTFKGLTDSNKIAIFDFLHNPEQSSYGDPTAINSAELSDDPIEEISPEG